MRLSTFAIALTVTLVAVLPVAAGAPSPAAGAKKKPPAAAAERQGAPPRAQVHYDLTLTRTDTPAPAAPSGDGSPAAPVPTPGAPEIVATPILNTTDLSTASISVTNPDLGYSLSLSPTLESAENSDTSVLTLWNLRLSGKAMPGGTNVVTITGSTRAKPGDDATLAEVPLRDPKTGQTSLFRLTARATVTPAAGK